MKPIRANNHVDDYLSGRASLRPLICEAAGVLDWLLRHDRIPSKEARDEVDTLWHQLKDTYTELLKESEE